MKQQISQMMARKYINYQYQLPEYNPTADFEWIRRQSGLPWLPLTVSVPHEIVLAEIKNVESLLSQHREDYNDHRGWKSFCMHGKAYDATREDEYYKDSRPHTWTDQAIELMPTTVEFFKTWWPGDQYRRLRIMLLEPGGYISIHRDSDRPGLTAINIAITQPTGCNFIMEGKGSVPFVPGQAVWIDISNNHTVFNNSNQNRWHLIVHQNLDNQNFQDEVVKSYNTMYNNYNENSHNCNPR
jgi:hypothetical protein